MPSSFVVCNAQERLAQQKEEAQSNPEYSSTFKGQLSKDEKKARRKAILANIGAPRCRHCRCCAHATCTRQQAFGHCCA